jgi:hypothetical protein
LSRRFLQRYCPCLAGLLAGAATPASAVAVDVELSGTTVFQGYEVASPWGYDVERRRLLGQVGFSLYHLQGDYVPGNADYNVRVLFRVDSDFGLTAPEVDFAEEGGSRFLPGVSSARMDLMQAYVEGRHLADGWLSFRAGRQYVTDALGWWNFDGGLIRLHTPAFFDVEAYGGFEQRGGLLLSTGRFESQGVWRGDHSNFDDARGPRTSDFPSFHEPNIAPAFGFALESAGPNWIHGRFTYRRVYNAGEILTRQFEDPAGGYPSVSGLRLSSERLGWAGNVAKTDLGGLKGGFSYDLYNAIFPTVFGGLEAYAGPRVTVGADVDHYHPTFDADSIFNWFTHNPNTTAQGRVAVRITSQIDLAAQGGVRLFSTDGDPDEFASVQCEAIRSSGVTDAEGKAERCLEGLARYGIAGLPGGEDALAVLAATRDPENRGQHLTADGIGTLVGRWRDTLGNFEVRGMAQVGARGHRAGGDLSGERSFEGGLLSLGARASLYGVSNRLDSEDPGNLMTFGYVLGAGTRPLDLAKIGAEFEHDINERVGHRFRVLARLDVLWGR